jgi:hypothetical protein
MIDAVTIHQCADPGLKPAIVEKFIKAVGSPNPLAVTIRAGSRAILVSPPHSPDEAMELIRRHLGQAMIRVGVTQYPAGFGVTDVAELKPDLLDACANIKMGTALFGKVYRIVVKWYGTPADQAFGDAIEAWKTGYFDGKYVFDQPDHGGLPARKGEPDDSDQPVRADDGPKPAGSADSGAQPVTEPGDPNKAGIRIDLTGIGVGKPK